MRRATLLLSIIAATGQSAACGHDDMDMMTDHAAELESHLGRADSEMSDHHDRINAAGTLGDARAEEAAHEARMTDHAAAMMHEMGDMAGCMHDGSGDMSAMLDDVGRLDAERADHATRMGDVTTLVEAAAEEIRHHDRMSGVMDDLRDHMASLMSDAVDVQCPHHE